METLTKQAQELLDEFKGNTYVRGVGCLAKVGRVTAGVAKRVTLVRPHSRSKRADDLADAAARSLAAAGVEMTFAPDLPGLYKVAVTVTAGGDEDRAVVAFEVEGEPLLTEGDDDDAAAVGDDDDAADDDVGSNTNPGDGCSCTMAAAGAGPLLASWLPLALLLRRRAGRSRAAVGG